MSFGNFDINRNYRGTTNELTLLQSMERLPDTFSSISQMFVTAHEQPDDTLIAAFVDHIRTAGFSSVRFYEITENNPSEGQLLILSYSAGATRDRVGYLIDLADTTLARSGDLTRAAVDENETKKDFVWISDLALEQKSWVDIPVFWGNRLVALLACDWPRGTISLTKTDLILLEAIGGLFSRFFDQRRASKIALDFAKSTDAELEFQPAKALLIAALPKVCSTIGAAVAGLFEFDLNRGLLVKIAEECTPKYRSGYTPFAEEYEADSPYLTAQAFRADRYRYVANFPKPKEIAESPYSFLAEIRSYDRHVSLLGNLASVMYYRLTGEGAPFMLRLINKATNNKVGFTLREKYKLDAIGDAIRDQVDGAVTKCRLETLQELALTATMQEMPLEKRLLMVQEKVEEEGLPGYMLFAANERSVNWSYSVAYPVTKPWTEIAAVASVPDRFLTARIRHSDTAIVCCEDALAKYADSEFLQACMRAKVGYLFCHRFRSDGLVGLLLFPIVAGPSVSQGVVREAFGAIGKKKALASFATIIAAIIHNQEARREVRGALNILGYIGHEVNTPASVVASQGMKAVLDARELISENDMPARNALIALREKLEKASGEMATMMEVAMMISKENEGNLQVFFDASDLSELVSDAVRTLKDELSSLTSDDPRRYAEFKITDGTYKLGIAVFDRSLIKQVLVNLLRNAVKYSLPRRSKHNIEIDIEGRRQQKTVELEIRNWGLGIDGSEMEKIFQPFVRGSVHDTQKAIRGMGLGLFLCRRMMDAHGGMVFCKSSNPTLHDFDKIEQKVGYTTTFCVRLPLGIKPGFAQHHWR